MEDLENLRLIKILNQYGKKKTKLSMISELENSMFMDSSFHKKIERTINSSRSILLAKSGFQNKNEVPNILGNSPEFN